MAVMIFYILLATFIGVLIVVCLGAAIWQRGYNVGHRVGRQQAERHEAYVRMSDATRSTAHGAFLDKRGERVRTAIADDIRRNAQQLAAEDLTDDDPTPIINLTEPTHGT